MSRPLTFDTKWSYLTRRVHGVHDLRLGPVSGDPQPGELVVADVGELGNHTHLETVHGRRSRLYPGDLVVGAHGNRYASDYYEGYVSSGRTVHLLAASGLMGAVASTHAAHADPTRLRVLGALLGHEDRPLSLTDFARRAPTAEPPRFGSLAVVGSTMNAGKTTTTAAILRGWRAAGLRAGAGKVTGTGSGKDRWAYVDAGAAQVCDFLDFGIVSTYGEPLSRLRTTMVGIRAALVEDGADAAALELADGLFQQETRGLLPALGGFVDGLVLAVADPLAAQAGAEFLRQEGLPLRAISGLITASPLAAREAAAVTGLPVLSPAALAEGAAVELLASPALA